MKNRFSSVADQDLFISQNLKPLVTQIFNVPDQFKEDILGGDMVIRTSTIFLKFMYDDYKGGDYFINKIKGWAVLGGASVSWWAFYQPDCDLITEFVPSIRKAVRLAIKDTAERSLTTPADRDSRFVRRELEHKKNTLTACKKLREVLV